MSAEQMMQQAFVFYLNPVTTDKAAICFEKVIQSYPQYVDAYFWLAYCLWEYICDWEKAEKIAHRGLKLDPSRADLHEVLAWIIHRLHGYTQRYEEQLKIAKSLELTWLTPRCCLIEYYLHADDLKKAKQEVAGAIPYIKNYPLPEKGSIKWVYEYFITGKISDSWKIYLLEKQQELKSK